MCDKYTEQVLIHSDPTTNKTMEKNKLHRIIKGSKVTKGRLVHYYSRSEADIKKDINPDFAFSSMYGSVGSYPDAYEDVSPASPVAYHTLKGGILQMTRHLAVYWASKGVRVNSLSPGPFPAPGAPRGMVQRLEQKSPMKRMGRPDELKGAIVFLASQASSYMTGQNLVIDGGWTAW